MKLYATDCDGASRLLSARIRYGLTSQLKHSALKFKLTVFLEPSSHRYIMFIEGWIADYDTIKSVLMDGNDAPETTMIPS